MLNSLFCQKTLHIEKKYTIYERLYINSPKAEIPTKNNGHIYNITSYITERTILDVRNSYHISTKIQAVK